MKRYYIHDDISGDRIRYCYCDTMQQESDADNLYIDFLGCHHISESEAMQIASRNDPIYPEIILCASDYIISSERFSNGSELQIADVEGEIVYLFSKDGILFEEISGEEASRL